MALNRGRHRCSAGRPSRWALAHILVCSIFTSIFLLVLYLACIAHNAMPKKISTKCNVFLQLIILRPHPHFTRLKICRSANPHFTGGQRKCRLSFHQIFGHRPLTTSVWSTKRYGVSSSQRVYQSRVHNSDKLKQLCCKHRAPQHHCRL